MEQERKNRLQRIDDCKTLDELGEDIFPSKLDPIFNSQKQKRLLLIDWVESCMRGDLSRFKSKTITDVVEEIYPPQWDDASELFQDLRRHLIKWIENYILQ